MRIWKQSATLEGLNSLNEGSMAEGIEIIFTEVGDDYLVATMPANAKTVQPFRILHGGANVTLAETLGSIASTLCLDDPTTQSAVGLESGTAISETLILYISPLSMFKLC